MYLFLLSYTIFDVLITSSTIVIARKFFYNIKAGMLIYLFANIINLLIAYLSTRKVVYYNGYIVLLTGGFTISTLLYFYSMYMNMPSLTFNNYYSLKFIIVSILSIYLLKTRYHKMQWIGKVLISLGISLQFLNDKKKEFSWSIITALFSGSFNAFSTVLFEFKIRDSLSSMWEYLFTFNFCYLPFNILSATIENHLHKTTKALISMPFYILVILNVFSIQSSIYLSMYVDSFERTIISVICNILSSYISDKILGNPIDLNSLISFFLVFLGTILYVSHKKNNTDRNEKTNL